MKGALKDLPLSYLSINLSSIKGNFRFYVVSDAMFSPGFSLRRLLYCETIKISIFIR